MLEHMPNFARNTLSMVQVSNLTNSNKHVYICSVYKHIYILRLEGLHLAMHKNPGAGTMLSSRAEGSARLYFPPAASMWTASPLGTTHVSLPRGFLSYKKWITKMFSKKHWCNHKTLQHQKKHAFASIGYLHFCIFASVCHPLLLWKCSSLIILPQLAPGCCKEENDLQPVSLFYHFGWLYLPCNTETSCLDTINRNFPRKNIYI